MYLLTYLLIYLLTYLLTYLFTDLLIYWLTYLLTHLFTYLFTDLFTHLFTDLFTYLFTHLYSYLFTYLFTHLFTLLIYLLIYWLTYLPTYLFTDLLIYSLTYLFTHLLIYSLHYLLTYLLPYLPTPCSTVLLEKPTGFQPVKKFPAFYGTRMFVIALRSARHLSLSWASSTQSMLPHPTSWRYSLILSSHLCLCLPSGLIAYGFPNKTLHTTLLSIIRATCPAHHIHLYFVR